MNLEEAIAKGERQFNQMLKRRAMHMNQHYFVFDVESIGLHGEAFAVGAVVIDATGAIHRDFKFAVPPDLCAGDANVKVWIAENIPPLEATHKNPHSMRDDFWVEWARAKKDFPGIYMAAECGWPVEANFLRACVLDDPEERKWDGPYPLLEIASFMLAAGMDPMATYVRLPEEMPKHCPLADSRQSARLLLEAIANLR